MILFFKTALRRVIAECKGATAIEYGLIVAAISVVIVITLFLFGDELNSMLSLFTGKMQESRSGL